MNTLELRNYRAFRSYGNTVSYAHGRAKTHAKWQSLGDKVVRYRIEPDEIYDWEFLKGDCYNVELNSDAPGGARAIKAQEKEFEKRVMEEGVWGIITEYWNGEEWIEAESCWGFVGEDWRDSGYLEDLMESAMDQLAKVTHCKECGRPKK